MKKDSEATQRRLLATFDRYQLTSKAKDICRKYRVTLDEVTSGKRTHPLPWVRAAIWSWLRDEGMSYPRIAEFFGVHHTTVMSGVRRHIDRDARAEIR